MYDVGVVHGRFQPFHLDHLKYVLAAKRKARFLCVGITNPDPSQTAFDKTNPERSDIRNNPFSYYERMCMVRDSLVESGEDRSSFDVVPFPINFPDRWQYYVPLNAVFFVSIYDEWGERKLNLLSEHGLKTDVLWRKPVSEKGLSATMVREALLSGDEYRSMMPPACFKLISTVDIKSRINPGKHAS